MVEQFFGTPVNQCFEVPELVRFHQIRVVVGEDEVGVVFQEQIGDVVQMNQPVQRRRVEFVLPAKFVAEQAGRLVHVMNQLRVSGGEVGGMMVNDDPVRSVQSLLKRQVADPG